MNYLHQAEQYRRNVDPGEISLIKIRAALFGLFGVKDGEGEKRETSKPVAEQTSFPTMKITEKEKNEWAKAGYPDLKKWLKKNRKRKIK